jgi:biotin carboxyl carrier protein
MDKKKQEGYVTGLVCLLIFALFAYFTVMSISNTSATVIMGIFTALFGGLGFGSLARPDTVGAVASQLLRNLSKSSEEASSDSHDKQIQKRSSGVQVMAHDQSSVSITVQSGKKKNAQNLPEESENLQDDEEVTLRKETIVVAPSDGYSYEFDLTRGDHVRGEITSTSVIDVLFADEPSFDKWSNGRKYFEPENSNDSILDTTFDYVAPRKGKWYVIIENNGRKSTTVKVHIY